MSGQAEDAAHAKHDPAGLMFLQKPFSPDVVAENVRAVLDARRERP
jgi:hypothetical protein